MSVLACHTSERPGVRNADPYRARSLADEVYCVDSARTVSVSEDVDTTTLARSRRLWTATRPHRDVQTYLRQRIKRSSLEPRVGGSGSPD